ncbi:MAG: transposase, partial [Nitrospinae bacterium]|nr:transposase [Nitrospinota bacterium]
MEKKIEEIVKPVKHVHITFTIPKLLRAYFRRNRKLLTFLPKSANYAVSEYFKQSLQVEGGMGGGIYYVQTYGSYYNYHPHIHAIVCAGVEKEGVFY